MAIQRSGTLSPEFIARKTSIPNSALTPDYLSTSANVGAPGTGGFREFQGIDPNTGIPYGGYGGYADPNASPEVQQFAARRMSGERKPLAPNTETASPSDEDTSFRDTPGYDWRRDQGAQVVENSAIGRGGLLSGRAAKELERFGQDYGAAEYQNVFNRRATIAGLQPASVQDLNAAASNYAANSGSILQNLGQGQASTYLTRGAGQNNAIQGYIDNYLFNQIVGG